MKQIFLFLMDINIQKKRLMLIAMSPYQSGCIVLETGMFGMNTFNNELHKGNILEYNLI